MTRASVSPYETNDSVTALGLNSKFSALATATTSIDGTNLSTGMLRRYHLPTASFVPTVTAVRMNTNTTTLTGTSYTLVTNGTTSLTTGPVVIPANGALWVRWRCAVTTFVRAGYTNDPIAFRIVGDGVQLTGSPIWSYSPSTSQGGTDRDQAEVHNVGGEFFLRNATGAPVTITALDVQVLPRTVGAITDGVTIGSGILIAQTLGRIGGM